MPRGPCRTPSSLAASADMLHDVSGASLAVLARHGRSFRLAGRLLPADKLRDAATLYGFCRAVDDLADETPDAAAARAELTALRAALLTGDLTHPPTQGFLALSARHGVRVEAGAALIDTVMQDLQPKPIADLGALLDYAHGAAGTVGEMMCAVLGVRDPQALSQALPRATDLGVAMQLTNIARDVIEDAARGRIYLPATWLPDDLTATTLASRPEAVFAAVRAVLDIADLRYRSAEEGLAYLPWRVRPSIRAAARLYEEIGLIILRRGPAYLSMGRCVVPAPRKFALVASSLLASGPASAPVSRAALSGARA